MTIDAPKTYRPVSEIQQQYQNLCTKAGHLQYQIFTLQKDLAMTNDTLRDLNVEAGESQKAAEATAAKEAAAKAQEADAADPAPAFLAST